MAIHGDAIINSFSDKFLFSWVMLISMFGLKNVKMQFASKKNGYIKYKMVAPIEDDLDYDELETEDTVVNSWFINFSQIWFGQSQEELSWCL